MKNKLHIPSSRRTFAIAAFAATIASVLSCRADDDRGHPGSNYGWGRDSGGTVYVASNAAAGNQILAFSRDSLGRLTSAGQFATGGTGTGGGLGNQGGLVLSSDGRCLLAVNAGSNDISTFTIGRNGLTLVDRKPSGGVHPLSIAVSDDLVYVVNAGGAFGSADNISGFHLDGFGHLRPIANSSRPLSAANSGPAQISFNNEGDVLLVTEKGTNMLTTFTVGQAGVVTSQQSTASSGATPFGFAFAGRDKVFVSNAAGGAPNAGSVSSYFVDEFGAPLTLANSVSNQAAAPCWVVVNANASFAYIANTASNSVSRMKIGSLGSLTLIDNTTTGNLSGPTDEALSADGRYLYVRNGGANANSVSIYLVNADGSLTAQPALTGLPAGANGVVAR